MLLLNQTVGSWELRKWSQTWKTLDFYLHSPCQCHRKCIKNSMENMYADVRLSRVKGTVRIFCQDQYCWDNFSWNCNRLNLKLSILHQQLSGRNLKRGRDHLMWVLLQFISGSIQKNPVSLLLMYCKCMYLQPSWYCLVADNTDLFTYSYIYVAVLYL